eukprot:1642830-Prymnesium_polylepis.2
MALAPLCASPLESTRPPRVRARAWPARTDRKRDGMPESMRNVASRPSGAIVSIHAREYGLHTACGRQQAAAMGGVGQAT